MAQFTTPACPFHRQRNELAVFAAGRTIRKAAIDYSALEAAIAHCEDVIRSTRLTLNELPRDDSSRAKL